MIGPFQGEYRWLSNFWPVLVFWEDILYPSVEHAYQAAKSPLMTERRMIAGLPTAGKAKREGRYLTIRIDWEAVKVDIMLELLRIKFRSSDLKAKLIATGKEELVEVNSWGDTFWGVCNGEGQNQLGKLLMKVREEIIGNA
jgi:ribA/ribD-fused uncharacterized protein